MSNLTNSIVRGFGLTIGRKTANKLLDSSKVKGPSGSLSFWQGIKTILWFIPMYIVSLFLMMFWDMFTKDFLAKTYTPNFPMIFFWAIIFTFIIGYNYYQDNKTK
jgi:hypothetical protein